jgi:hypothetical protein
MSRRSIVVENTTYHWETNGHSIAIIPPKGAGKTLRFDVAKEIGVAEFDYDDWGSMVAITPRDIASLIYRDFLKKPMPEPKKWMPRRAIGKPAPVIHWQTAAEMPRTYLVQATVALPDGKEASIPLEVHETTVTAREAVHRLNGHEAAKLVRRAIESPTLDVLPRRRGDEFHAVSVLIAWLRSLTLPSGYVPVPVITTSELPFKITA